LLNAFSKEKGCVFVLYFCSAVSAGKDLLFCNFCRVIKLKIITCFRSTYHIFNSENNQNQHLQNLINKIKQSIPLSLEAEKYIYSIAKEKSVAKGEVLIDEGQTVNKIFFVTQGSLRSFCVDKEGKEHTLQFAINEWWISDFIAIYNEVPASLTVESITDSTVIEFNAQKLNEIYLHFPEFELFQRKNLERHVVSLHKRILNQLQLTALERYKLFLEQYPNIERDIPNYHIASYLGITQQSLSRLRAERAKK
jgi:CRP-like cAMP-binding protein